jgi:hypothetical protein
MNQRKTYLPSYQKSSSSYIYSTISSLFVYINQAFTRYGQFYHSCSSRISRKYYNIGSFYGYVNPLPRSNASLLGKKLVLTNILSIIIVHSLYTRHYLHSSSSKQLQDLTKKLQALESDLSNLHIKLNEFSN